MKSQTIVNGSSSGLAAMFRLESTVGFLSNRSQVIHLIPINPDPNMGYVWRRVFLRARNAI